MEKIVQQSFLQFKPDCDKLITKTSSKAVSNIKILIDGAPEEILQSLQNYILFPFIVQLRNKSSREQFRQCLVETMNIIYQKTHIDSEQIFFKYYSTLMYQIYDKGKPNFVADCSEELKLSVLTTVTSLFLSVLPVIRLKIYKKENTPQFGQGIFLCVHIAKKEQFRQLRITAIRCIQAICSLHDDLTNENGDIDDPVLEISIGDIIMFFLPGIMGALQEVANGDEKQGHQVTVIALATMRRILCATMKDIRRAETHNLTNEDFLSLVTTQKENKLAVTQSNNIDGESLKKTNENKIKFTERNSEWYKMAGEKLAILVKSLDSLKSHSHNKVRLELAVFCKALIEKCARNMMPSMQHMLEILVALSEDKDDSVREVARSISNSFLILLQETTSQDLVNIIEENLNSTLMKLPRYLNNLDSNKKLAILNILCGYLRLLSEGSGKPEKLVQVLSSEHILQKFVFALIETAKLETTNIRLLGECSVRDVEVPVMTAVPWRCFTHLTDTNCSEKLMEICHILGRSESVDLISDYLMDVISNQGDNRNEVILLLNEIIAEPNKDYIPKHSLIKQLIDAYTEPTTWYLPVTVDKSEKPLTKDDTLDVSIYNPRSWDKEYIPGLYEGAVETRYTDISYDEASEDEILLKVSNRLTISKARSNVLQICLMTEGIGMMAKSLRKGFQPYLLKMLYLILERAGSNNETIHLAGIKALQDITIACGLREITDLIRINADYFTHQIMMKLRKVNEDSNAFHVLSVVMSYSDVRGLPFLYNIVTNISAHCGSSSQEQMITYLQVLYTFIKCICKWFPVEISVQSNQQRHDDVDLFDGVLEYIKNKEASENLLTNEEYEREKGMSAEEMFQEDLIKKQAEDESVDDIPSVNEAPKSPQHIEMTVIVLKRCLNLMATKDRDQKLLILDTINSGITLLKDYEDELLPLVHLVWSPLVVRFTEQCQPVVINRAFQLLVTMAQVAKDFIRSRTLKEVLPSLLEFLRNSSKDSYLKDIGSWYRHTQAYKLQLALLSGLGNLVVSMKVQDKYLYDTLCTVEIYLNAKQPKTLQISACELFKTVMAYDPNVVFLHLNSLFKVKSFEPPQCIIKLEICNTRLIDNSNDFKSNVIELLNYYDANNK